MINANELRIGNLVEKNGVVYVADFITIRMAHNYNPIPLTPEILEKAGFEIQISQIDFWKKGKVYMYWDGEELSANFGHIEQLDVHVKYLHQLQNLFFALTGEELTVSL